MLIIPRQVVGDAGPWSILWHMLALLHSMLLPLGPRLNRCLKWRTRRWWWRDPLYVAELPQNPFWQIWSHVCATPDVARIICLLQEGSTSGSPVSIIIWGPDNVLQLQLIQQPPGPLSLAGTPRRLPSSSKGKPGVISDMLPSAN